jgi:hypothetical protein
MATFSNALIIGKSKNPALDNFDFNTYGIIVPRADRFLVDGVKFFNFGQTGYSLFSSCSRCEISSASTDSDGRTAYFKNIKTDGTEKNVIKWAQPRRAIFRDLDGSLSGTPGTPSWITAYYPHNLVSECKRDSIKFDDSTICQGNIQIRRVAFSQATPGTFTGQAMKVLRVPGVLESLPIAEMGQPINFSVLPFKENKDPVNGWSIPFVTGYNYLLSFGNIGLEFDSVAVERSIMWEGTDRPINLAFNYTYRRDEYTVKGTDSSNTAYNGLTGDLAALNILSTNGAVPYGTFLNNIAKKYLYMRINGLDMDKFNSHLLTVTAIQCKNNDCGAIPPNTTEVETTVRKWSDVSNWPNKLLPAKGDVVEIPFAWTMLLDISTANLKKLTIYGTLLWDNTDLLELKAENIINYGKFVIGTEETPFTKIAKVTLTGDKYSSNVALTNNVQLPNKALVNIGEINFVGENRAPYNSRLLASVKVGDTKITVDKNLLWKAGDEIVVTTTTFVNSETERFTITSYDKVSGDTIL